MSHGRLREASFDCGLRRSSGHQFAVKEVARKAKSQQLGPGECSTIHVQVTATALGLPAFPCRQISVVLAY